MDPHAHLKNFQSFLVHAKKKFEDRWNHSIPEKVSLEDFKILQTLGTGSFGRVLLVRFRKGDTPFALKMLEKAHVVKTKQIQHTISEIKIMDAFDFPFLIKLEYFFKDNVYLCLVMPFINGGEMFSHLRQQRKFSEDLTRFYASQVILAFEYMHFIGIVYRDLKPENILLDRQGYLKVTDYGFCKRIGDQRTYTLCGNTATRAYSESIMITSDVIDERGNVIKHWTCKYGLYEIKRYSIPSRLSEICTPEYLAPEIILSQGYNKSVDWWSLGVLIFEMAAGYPPFYAREPMKIYEKIVSGKYTPASHFSKSLRDLIMHILQVDRTKRYGILKDGAKDVKIHPFFKGFDWDGILLKKIKAPFIPSTSGDGDASNFDNYEETPLKTASKNLFSKEFANFDA